MVPIGRAMTECCVALAHLAPADPGRSPRNPQIVSHPMPPKRRSPAQLAAAGRGSKTTAAKHHRTAAGEGPVIESNDERLMQPLDEPTDDPVGRRIDAVLTTMQRFNVAGFGNVRAIAVA